MGCGYIQVSDHDSGWSPNHVLPCITDWDYDVQGHYYNHIEPATAMGPKSTEGPALCYFLATQYFLQVAIAVTVRL